MKKFRFRLDKVVDVRDIEERQAQKNLAGAQHERQIAERAHDDAKDELVKSDMKRRDQIKKGFSAGEAVTRHLFQRRLVDDVAEKKTVVDKKSENVKQRRDILIDVNRKRQALQSLRDKRLSEHNQTEGRKEQSELDGQAARRHYYKSKKL